MFYKSLFLINCIIIHANNQRRDEIQAWRAQSGWVLFVYGRIAVIIGHSTPHSYLKQTFTWCIAFSLSRTTSFAPSRPSSLANFASIHLTRPDIPFHPQAEQLLVLTANLYFANSSSLPTIITSLHVNVYNFQWIQLGRHRIISLSSETEPQPV